MRTRTVYLYRKAGAIGAATHWAHARDPLHKPGFEFLGHGIADMRQRSMFSEYVALVDDIFSNFIGG